MVTMSVGEGEAGLECLRAVNDAKGGNVDKELDGKEASAAGAPRHGTGDDDKGDKMREGGSGHGKEVESPKSGGEDGVNGPAARASQGDDVDVVKERGVGKEVREDDGENAFDDGRPQEKVAHGCSVPKDGVELEEGSARDGAAALGNKDKVDGHELPGCGARDEGAHGVGVLKRGEEPKILEDGECVDGNGHNVGGLNDGCINDDGGDK